MTFFIFIFYYEISTLTINDELNLMPSFKINQNSYGIAGYMFTRNTTKCILQTDKSTLLYTCILISMSQTVSAHFTVLLKVREMYLHVHTLH